MNRFIETWPKISQLIIQKQIVYEYIFINKVHLIVTAHEKHNELQVFTGGERTIEGFNSISSKLLTSLCPTLPWPDDITHCSREILRKRLFLIHEFLGVDGFKMKTTLKLFYSTIPCYEISFIAEHFPVYKLFHTCQTYQDNTLYEFSV